MIIIFLVSIILFIVGLFIIILGTKEAVWAFGIALFVCAFMSFITTGVWHLANMYEINTLKEKIKHPTYYTAEELQHINSEVADIKAHDFIYYGINKEGIEYVDLDLAGSAKINIKKE